MSNTDRDSMLERWADGMEKLEQYYEGIYGPPATPPSLPPITTRDAMLEAIADGVERVKRNINKKSPTYHNSAVAYTKTVPAGDVHYASLEQIGGRTLIWNQLVNPANIGASKEQNGITFTNNGDGSITVSGTATGGNAALMILSARTWKPHRYCLRGCPSGGSSSTYNLRLYGSGSNFYDTGDGVIWYHATALYKQCEIVIMEGTVISTPITFRPTFVDLTIAFGSGNEPTLAEFKQQFPAPYYAHNPGSLLSAGVTSVVSKDSTDTEIDTYSIPAEIQALEGYGWSAGTVFNYIDFERKVFVKNVASVDLGTLTWGYGPSVGWSATLNAKNPADDDTVFNGISATLTPVTRNAQATAFSGGTDAGMVSVSGGKVYVGTGDIGIVPSGTLYYELDEPVETDISEYLTDDNLISVESGGSLTFPNQHGDDYRIDVPSSVTFVVGEP